MNLMMIISLVLGGLILIGFLIGLIRSWKKSIIRVCLLLICFAAALILSSKVADILMNKYVDGLVISIFGQTIDFESIAGELAGDLLSEGSAMTTFATALLNIAVKLIGFLIIFVSLMIVTLVIYYIIAAIMSAKAKKKAIGKVKPKFWERLIGGIVGIIGSLIVCLALFTPVFGVMGVCDKFLENGDPNTASAYSAQTYVAGKFYTEDENIGKVETYLEKYDKIRTEYKKSFAGYVFTYTGIDAMGKTTFKNLSTVKKNGVTVNFTEECVNMVNVYNLYKINFVENKFDITTEKGVNALKNIYGIAKNSEVLRSFVVDLVPKMATKWSNGEKFLGMEIPVQGDMKELAIELLGVYNSTDFEVIDRNIEVLFDVITVANSNDVIKSINEGADILDVIDNGTFVKDEITTLATTPEYKRALPNIMTTTIKLAYKSVLSDPGTKLDQDFTQEQVNNIVWSTEAELTQTIVSKIFKIFDSEDILDCLTDFGVVIDSARESKIMSKPVKILMYDYIDQKVTEFGSSKETILNAFNTNWDNPNYKFKDLFETVETTAKVAKDLENASLEDLKPALKNLLENEEGMDAIKGTIQGALNDGALDSLLGEENKDKANAYKDLVNGVLEETTKESIDSDLQAGQVIVDIIKSKENGESMLEDRPGETKADKADAVIETISNSNAIMKVLENENNKTESENAAIKGYVDGLNENDAKELKDAVNRLDDSDPNKATLSKLFGLTK